MTAPTELKAAGIVPVNKLFETLNSRVWENMPEISGKAPLQKEQTSLNICCFQLSSAWLGIEEAFVNAEMKAPMDDANSVNSTQKQKNEPMMQWDNM